LVEGTAESMLLPHFIRLKYPELYQRYVTILSVNGRHSHLLNPLIQKLCLPTLVITDLDPAKADGHHRSALPERGKNLISSNYAIAKWTIQEKELDKLLDLPEKKKEIPYASPYKYSIRVAYQTPVTIEFNNSKEEAISSTFEDCLIYTNFDLIKDIKIKEAGSLIENTHRILNSASTFSDLHESIYNMLRDGSSKQKAEFALDVIYEIDLDEITVPAYIDAGLKWLQNYLHPED